MPSKPARWARPAAVVSSANPRGELLEPVQIFLGRSAVFVALLVRQWREGEPVLQY